MLQMKTQEGLTNPKGRHSNELNIFHFRSKKKKKVFKLVFSKKTFTCQPTNFSIITFLVPIIQILIF